MQNRKGTGTGGEDSKTEGERQAASNTERATDGYSP